MLNQKIKGHTFFRTIFYIPMIVPVAATAVLFSWLFQTRIGIVNNILTMLNLPNVRWLVTETWSKPTIVIVSLWRIGESIIIFLAGLQGIPKVLYEAAEVDGANSRQKLFRITIPMLAPTILFVLIIEVITMFQAFIWAFVMTKGGPLNSTLFYVLYIYRQAFQYFDMGYASALAVILFILVLLLTISLFKWSRSWVYTEVE
jgi:multiple sugar transport system permease protein